MSGHLAGWRASLGLYDPCARYYDPALGRFVQADTVVPEAGNPQALNRYAYVYNNPLRYTDPSGHWTFEEEPGDPYFIGPWLYEAQRRRDFITPHEPASGEFVAVATSPFWASALAVGVTAPVAEGAAPPVTAAFKFAIAHPLEAAIAKAVAEEAFEATVTGTPFDPANVALDVLTQVGDEVVPRRQRVFGEPVEFEGVRVYPRTDIDWDMTDNLGRTNRQRMQRGLAPLGVDGKPINMHHIGQRPKVVAEVTSTVHRKYSSVLHKNTGPSQIDRHAFGAWRQRWWRQRAR